MSVKHEDKMHMNLSDQSIGPRPLEEQSNWGTKIWNEFDEELKI